jgi:uncharacterized protein (UPF0212 family)
MKYGIIEVGYRACLKCGFKPKKMPYKYCPECGYPYKTVYSKSEIENLEIGGKYGRDF